MLIISNNVARTNLVPFVFIKNKERIKKEKGTWSNDLINLVCAGERVPEETDDRGGEGERRGQRGGEEDNGRPRQTRWGDLPARGQGQEWLHLPRRVQWAEARRALKPSCRVAASPGTASPTCLAPPRVPIQAESPLRFSSDPRGTSLSTEHLHQSCHLSIDRSIDFFPCELCLREWMSCPRRIRHYRHFRRRRTGSLSSSFARKKGIGPIEETLMDNRLSGSLWIYI